MESKEAVKAEESIRSWSFSDHVPASSPVTGVLDLGEKSSTSLGFMELLGIQDFSPSIFDILQGSAPSVESFAPTQSSEVPESSEVLMNQPTTPNSSSISSESSVAPNDEQSKAVDEEEEQQKTKNNQLLKAKKTSQKKRQREPRFAFMTKSEVDHLEDGYRWRKYGQKAVKNSPFPRGYYRCTTATCNVKKRVERSFSDPSIVVTTYEGKHTHPSPLVHRPTSTSVPLPPARHGFSAVEAAYALSLPHQQSQFMSNSSVPPHPLNCGYLSSYLNPSVLNERRFCKPASSANLLTDHGLLQDIVPSSSLVRKQED